MTSVDIEAITKYNQQHSPKILLRMGWSYYDTESSARSVAMQADKDLTELLKIVRGPGEYSEIFNKVEKRLVEMLNP